MVDVERLFTFRALAFARGDASPLPSMDQDLWMAGADFEARPLRQLAEELGLVRQATLALFTGFTPEAASRPSQVGGALPSTGPRAQGGRWQGPQAAACGGSELRSHAPLTGGGFSFRSRIPSRITAPNPLFPG
jgi:hypothetical protein